MRDIGMGTSILVVIAVVLVPACVIVIWAPQ
jgi:hypothetical protein